MGLGLYTENIRQNVQRGATSRDLAPDVSAYLAAINTPTSSSQSTAEELASLRPGDSSEFASVTLAADQELILQRLRQIEAAYKTVSIEEERKKLRQETLEGSAPGDAIVYIANQPQGPEATFYAQGDRFAEVRMTIDEAQDLFLDSTPDEVGQIQTLMFQAGFYPDSTDIEDIELGVKTAADFKAWNALLQSNAKQYAADPAGTVPLFDWLADKASNPDSGGGGGGGGRRGGGGGGGGGAAAPLVFRLSDPAAIQELTSQIGQQVIGRRLSPEEQRRFVSIVHDIERGYQARAHEMALTGASGELIQPDVTAQLQQGVREEFDIEAQGHQLAGQFNTLRQMLDGI